MLLLLPAEKRNENRAIARLKTVTTEGRTAQVNIAGKAQAVFWYRVESERLIVETCVTFGEENNLEQSLLAINRLATSLGCKEVIRK